MDAIHSSVQVHNLRLSLDAPMRKQGVLPKNPHDPRDSVRLGRWARDEPLLVHDQSSPRGARDSAPTRGARASPVRDRSSSPSTMYRPEEALTPELLERDAIAAAHAVVGRPHEAIELLLATREVEVGTLQMAWLRSLAKAAGPLPAGLKAAAAEAFAAENAAYEEEFVNHVSARESVKVREFKVLKDRAKELGLPPPERYISPREKLREQQRKEQQRSEKQRRTSFDIDAEIKSQAPAPAAAAPPLTLPAMPPPPAAKPKTPKAGSGRPPTRGASPAAGENRRGALTARPSTTTRPSTEHQGRPLGGAPVPRGVVTARGTGRA